MNRPLISDFFPESFTPKDLNKVFLANPELYRYIQALDGYIDALEEETKWNHDMDNIPKGTDLLFVTDNEVKFGQFEYYDSDVFEALAEMITSDGDYNSFHKSKVEKWRLLPKP
jgi:hypothetical protein